MGDNVRLIRQGGDRPRPEVLALAALADYHTYSALFLGGETEQAAAEQSGGSLAVHAGRLAAELGALLDAGAAR